MLGGASCGLGPAKQLCHRPLRCEFSACSPRDPEGCSAVLHGDHHRITLYVYVDNIAVVGTRKEEVEDGIRTVMNDMEACGLSSSEDGHVCGATATSGPSHPTAQRYCRFRCALRWLLGFQSRARTSFVVTSADRTDKEAVTTTDTFPEKIKNIPFSTESCVGSSLTISLLKVVLVLLSQPLLLSIPTSCASQCS